MDDFAKALDDLVAELKDLPAGLERGPFRKAMEEMAVTVAAAVSQEAPVSDAPRTLSRRRTKDGPREAYVTVLPGNLKANIQARKVRTKKGEVMTGVEAPYYARFVEKGHTVKFGRNEPIVGHVPANAFMMRGFEKSKQWAMDLARRTLVEELEKRIARAKRKRVKAFLGS